MNRMIQTEIEHDQSLQAKISYFEDPTETRSVLVPVIKLIAEESCIGFRVNLQDSFRL